MKHLKSYLIIFIITTCSIASAFNEYIVDVRPFLRGNVSPQIRSAKILDQAEKLMTSYSFMYADELVDLALQFDPSNKKAQLYKKILKLGTGFKGIFSRLSPIVERYKNSGADQKLFDVKSIYGTGALYSYLMDGPKDLTKESQVQAVIDAFTNELISLREFLLDNLNLKISAVVLTTPDNPWSLVQYGAISRINFLKKSKEILTNCDVKKLGKYVFKMNDCPYLQPEKIVIDRVDLEMFRIFTSVQLFQSILYNAYSLDGYIPINIKKYMMYNHSKKKLTKKQYVDYFKTLSNFLILKSNNRLKDTPTLVSDVTASITYLTKNNEPCDQEKLWNEGKLMRPGHFFPQGFFCVSLDDKGESIDTREVQDVRFQENLQAIHRILGGSDAYVRTREKSHDLDLNPKRISAKINPSIVWSNPDQDLKILLPNKFNSCGNATSLPDQEWKRYFPDGEQSRYFLAKEKIGQKCKN